MTNRLAWLDYFMANAELISKRSTCDRAFVGAVLVKDKRIIATGYNGGVSEADNCNEVGHYMEDGHCIRTVHAEMNAIISAARSECIGGTIYLAGRDVATGELIPDLLPCPMCRRMIINAGLSKIVIRRTPSTYDILNVQDWVFHDDSVIDPSESGEQA